MSTLPELVKKLKAASEAYYNTATPIMTDEEYDTLRDELSQRSPNHPFLREVGATPESTVVQLPFIMASLNKIKPATGAVELFVRKATVKQWLLSEKLDGISALWHENRLYLRGNGQMGVDVTKFAPHIQGLKACEQPIRGELVVKRSCPLVAGTLARSWVNGQLHQKEPQAEIRVVRFLAYEILSADLTPSDQFKALVTAGFEVPWHQLIPEKFLTDAHLGTVLTMRREKSEYDNDGIVVAENIPSALMKSVKNPSNKMAFKMLVADQCAETTILEIEWNPSAQGYLIPRLRIQPVVVGTARIEFVTGHNARFIVENKLAPGAKIVIRRSGDVIPAVDRVVVSAAAPKLPDGAEGAAWVWVDDVHIILVRAEGAAESKEVQIAQLVHFAKTLEIEGLGPGVATKLVEGGLTQPQKLFAATTERLIAVVGKSLGPKLAAQFIALGEKATEILLMVASNKMPRGIGERKLKILFDLNADPRKWSTLPVPNGWTTATLNEVFAALPAYEVWRREQTPQIPYPKMLVVAAAAAAPVAQKGTVCFTGVRSKELETALTAAGWKSVSGVSSKLSALIVPDGPIEETEKVRKARELGTIRILQLSDVRTALGIV